MAIECPNCRRSLPIWRTLVRPMWSTWNCEHCGALLGIDRRRRGGVAVACGLMPVSVMYCYNAVGWNYLYAIPTILVLLFGMLVLFDRPRLIEAAGFRCRDCGYDLRGQRVPRCPECGREFDEHEVARMAGGDDGESMAKGPARRSLGMTIFIAALIVALTLLLVLGTHFYARWQRAAPPTPAPQSIDQ